MKRIVSLIAGCVAMLLVIIMSFKTVCGVDAGEIVVLQSLNGTLTVWTSPGWHFQGFGEITRYNKSDQFWFKAPVHEKETGDDKKAAEGSTEVDESIPLRFNDKGSARISGSLSFDLPLDEKTIIKLHTRFRGMDGIRDRLVRPSVVKAAYNSGPLMSSRESAGQRRGDLIQFIQDQATKGVYKTVSKESEEEDYLAPPRKLVELVDVPVLDEETKKPKLDDKGKPITKKEPQQVERPAMKKVLVVEPKNDDKGIPMVQEPSTIAEFNIRLYNITVERILYEGKVQEQINKQRDMEMAIQTKISEAKQAEQDVVTTEKKGQADAAKAKWEQEVKKAQAITEAEQKKEVATRDLETAKLQRQATIERAEGEAEAKRLVMNADGALEKKLAALVEINKAYALEFGKQKWVPEVQMGGQPGGSAAMDLMSLLQVKTARDLSLDLSVKK